MDEIVFAGESFRPLASGALYWPRRRALIVADLHFEKASWYATGGQMLPPYDSQATLETLETALDATGATALWVLGDSFHDADGPTRLPTAVADRLKQLIARHDWTWITGNHDSDSAATLGGQVCVETIVDGITLRHEARTGESGPELSGHFHPKWRVFARGRSVVRRCFVLGSNRLILPAFGVLTGGLDASAPVLRALAGPDGQAIIAVREGLLRFPIALRGR